VERRHARGRRPGGRGRARRRRLGEAELWPSRLPGLRGGRGAPERLSAQPRHGLQVARHRGRQLDEAQAAGDEGAGGGGVQRRRRGSRRRCLRRRGGQEWLGGAAGEAGAPRG
ncbi:unnamed protein product, partial [Prorocentrum cordatum]